MNFKNKVVWITGASSGIGAAMAHEFNAQGSCVILSARRKEVLEEVQKGFSNREMDSLLLPFDITNYELQKEAFEQIISKFGRLDIVIQNAGITCSGFAVDLSLDIHRHIMDVDYFSNVALTQTVLPHFIEKDDGQIIVVSSILGQLGTKNRSAYAAAKHALHGYYDCLRAELSRNIHVGILSPGYVRTDVMFNALTSDGSKLNKRTEDNDKGMLPEVFARKALRKIGKRKPITYVSGIRELLGIYLTVLTPSLYARIARKLKHDL